MLLPKMSMDSTLTAPRARAQALEPPSAPGLMQLHTYRILFESEATHWWLSSRRKIVLDWIEAGHRGNGDLRILDVGCGTGLMIQQMAHLGQVDGVDLSRDALSFCRERGLGRLHLSRVEELPLRDASYDLVTAVDILEHLEADVAALGEWKRVLRPGGRLVLFVPAHNWLWSLQDDVSGHQLRYTARTLRRSVEAAGLRIQRLSYVSALLLPVIYLGRQWLKVQRRFRAIDTENDLHPAWSNGLLGAIFRTEIPILRHVDLPIGASIICVAVKDEA